MTREETLKILSIIYAAYPSFTARSGDVDRVTLVNLWQESFKSDNYSIVAQALKAFIDTDDKGFPPSIGQVKKNMRLLTKAESMNEMEAWSYVSKAIRNGNYAAEEEFEKLPPLVKKAVGRPANIKEWGLLPTDEVETVIQSNFMRSYRTVVARQEQYDSLPDTAKEIMQKVNALSKGQTREIKSIPTKE